MACSPVMESVSSERSGWILDARLPLDRRSTPAKSGHHQADAPREPCIHHVETVRCPQLVDVLRFVREQRRVHRNANQSFGNQVDLICVGSGDENARDVMNGDGIRCFWTIAHIALQAVNTGYSYLSTVDEIAVIQLCLAERNRKERGVFEAHTDDALSARDLITRRRLKAIDNRLSSFDRIGVPVSTDADRIRDKDDILIEDYESYLSRCNILDSVRLLSLMVSNDQQQRERDSVSLCSSGLDADLLLLQLPVDPVQKRMLEFLLGKKSTYIVSALQSVNDSSSDCVDADSFELNAVECNLSNVLSDSSKCQETSLDENVSSVPSELELHMERVVMAYLRLLLNTRDELALAIALGNMVNGFSHEAFTAIRKMSRSTGSLSMYQTAVSFVMKVRLGGKSYAPNSECPVRKYLPELSTFMMVMNKIQNIIEEEVDSVASFKRILTVLKVHLVKTCSAKCISGLNKAVQNIEKLVQGVIRNTQCPNRNSAAGQKTAQLLQQLLDCHATRVSLQHSTQVSLVDTDSNQNSPIRIPSILSQFRSPSMESPIKAMDASHKLNDTTITEVLVCQNSNECKVSSPVHEYRYHLSHTLEDGSESAVAKENKENPAAMIESNRSKEKQSKRCLNEVLSRASDGKRAKTDVHVQQPKRTKSASRRRMPTSTGKTKASKPVPKGQQLMTRFLRA